MAATRSRLFRFLTVLVWVIVLGPPRARVSAQAEADLEAYRVLIERALEEYNDARYEEARALFLRAHALRPSARTLRGLGMTEFELRHYADALRLIEQAQADRRHPLTDDQRREVDAVAERANAYVGRYHIALEPSTATLTVDGATPATPYELTLDIGKHAIQVSAPDHLPEVRNLDVKGGENVTLTIQLAPSAPAQAPALEPAAEPLPASEPSAPVTLAPVDVPISEPAPAARTRDSESSPVRPVIGWISLGVGVAGAATAIVAWRVGETAADHWNNDASCLRDGLRREQNCGEYRSTARTARTWTIIGVALAVTGAAASSLLLWPSGSAQAHDARAIDCKDGVGDVGVACTVRF